MTGEEADGAAGCAADGAPGCTMVATSGRREHASANAPIAIVQLAYVASLLNRGMFCCMALILRSSCVGESDINGANRGGDTVRCWATVIISNPYRSRDR